MKRLFFLTAVFCTLLFWVSTGFAQTGPNTYDQMIQTLSPVVHLRFGDAGGGPVDGVTGQQWGMSPTGTILYQQASQMGGGFSESLSYNKALIAPNNTQGNYDWNQPFSGHVLIKWQGGFVDGGAGIATVLMSKGILVGFNLSYTGQQGWAFFLYRNTSGDIEPCLMLTGAVSAGAAQGIQQCLSPQAAGAGLQAGNWYELNFTYDGSGNASGIRIWWNGFATGTTGEIATNNGPYTFDYDGNVNTTVGPAFSGSIHITNSQPLMINGDYNNIWSSASGTLGGPTLYDDVALVPGVTSIPNVESLFIYTDFWKQYLGAPPAVPKRVIVDEDGCQDSDNLAMLALAIRLHQLGYIDIMLVNDTEGMEPGWDLFRKMLNVAGLNHVPVSWSGIGTNQGGANANWTDEPFSLAAQTGDYCTNTTAAYDANVHQAWLQKPSDVQAYTAALNASPSGLTILGGGAWQGYYDCLLDGTCGPLFNSRVNAVYQQDGPSGFPYGTNCLVEAKIACTNVLTTVNQTTIPFNLFGGPCTPMCMGQTGPGEPYTRSGQFAGQEAYGAAILNGISTASQTEKRGSFDSWPLMGFLQSFTTQQYFTTPTGSNIGTWSVSGSNMVLTTGSGASTQATSISSTTPSYANTQLAPWIINSLINGQPLTTYLGTPVPAVTQSYPATPNLVSHWPTNEGTGTTLHDVSGNGNNVTGGTGYTWGNHLNNAGVPVYTSQQPNCASSSTLTNFDITQPFTIALWISANSMTGGFDAISDRNSGSAGYIVYPNVSGSALTYSFIAAVSAGVGGFISTTGTYSNTSTHHVAFVNSGVGGMNGITIYVDGQLVSSTIGTAYPGGSMASGTPLCMAYDPPTGSGGSANISIFNVEVYSTALTAGQVQNVYLGLM